MAAHGDPRQAAVLHCRYDDPAPLLYDDQCWDLLQMRPRPRLRGHNLQQSIFCQPPPQNGEFMGYFPSLPIFEISMEYQVCYITSILYFIYFSISIYFMVSERLPILAFEQHGSGYDDDMSFERMNIYISYSSMLLEAIN